MMRYISTRGGGGPKSFEDVLLCGLAPDGGLYLPEHWPQIDLESLKGKSYQDIAKFVMFPFVKGSIPQADFELIIDETYGPAVFRHPDVLPLTKILSNVWVMEQFHGPTLAFKDVALQLLGRLFNYVLEKRDEKVTIVGATSGDTGSAAIEGCRASDRIDIFILHPKGRVSDVQRRQMTTIHTPSVHNIALEGSFDDCQNAVKALFADVAFRDVVNLSAVNSINWARIMAQIVYYFTAALKLGAPDEEITFVVPTGNFGNIFAGYCARKMGLPIKLVIATNENDILTRFFESGTMEMRGVTSTITPSMDIEISSNFERYLFNLLERDADVLRSVMEEFKNTGRFELPEKKFNALQDFIALRADEMQTLEIMKVVHQKSDYITDPHTAVGVHAGLQIENTAQGPVVVLGTAHPAKFPEAVQKATGIYPDLPDHLSDLFEKEEHFDILPNDLQTLQTYIKKALLL